MLTASFTDLLKTFINSRGRFLEHVNVSFYTVSNTYEDGSHRKLSAFNKNYVYCLMYYLY